MRTNQILTLLVALAVTGQARCATVEPLPVGGRPVPELTGLDTVIRNFMEDDTRNIDAGVVGICRGGRVIYLRSFGWLRKPADAEDEGVPLGELALMRQASLAKPITAAAIQHLNTAGGFGTDPATERLNRRAFNIGGNNGLLNVGLPQGQGYGSPTMGSITVSHLLGHTGGWDLNNLGSTDHVFTALRAAGIQMNEPDALPTRDQFMGYVMQFPLDFTPGAASYNRNLSGGGTLAVTPGPGTPGTYSNFGYLVLGQILETHASGGYFGYLRDHVMSAGNWIPSTEFILSPTLGISLHHREPEYVAAGQGDSVYDYVAPIDKLPRQYGAFHLETMMAHGGLSISSQALLAFGSRYFCSYFNGTTPNGLGRPIPAAGLPAGFSAWHTGSLPGTSSILRQEGNGAGAADDLVIHIAFNRRDPANNADWATLASNAVIAWLNEWQGGIPTPSWPTAECDGFWVTNTEGDPAHQLRRGGYDRPYQGFANALAQTVNGSKLRLKPGTTAWTGTLTERLMLDAPEGPVTIGQN